METPQEEPMLLNLQQVARRLWQCVKTVRRLIDDGELCARRLRNRWVMTPDDLQDFVDNLKTNRRRKQA